MAGFGRSNSLSINTSGSLFGGNATTQGQQSAGLFASSTAASRPQGTGGLFGSTSQAQTGGLFGGAAPASQPPQATGLFGNLNKPQATTGTSGGLFGASTAQSQPQQGSSLFGGALGGSSQTQTQSSQPGGLFDGLGQNQNQNQNQTQAQKPSLFGSSTAQQTSTPSLFGNAQQQQPQQQSQSLFGGTQQNQPQQQTTSLFGGMNPQNRGLGLGGQSSNLGSTSAIQTTNLDNIKGNTRISDLAPEIQQQIYTLDDIIHAKMETANKVRETLPGHVADIELVAPDVAYIDKFLSTVELGLDNDSANIAHIKTLVKKDAEDATLSFRAIENQNLPPQFRYGNASNLSTSAAKPATTSSLDDHDDSTKPVDLIGYFNRRTDDLGRTLETYQRQIREIETHLRTMEAGTHEKAQQLMGTRNKMSDDRQQLVEALRAIESAIVDSAKKVGKVRDEVTKRTLGGVGVGLM